MQPFCENFFSEFELEIDSFKKGNSNPICQAKLALEYIEEKLKELYQWLENHKFCTIEEEIHFFKDLKCKITSKYIFYNKILDIETNSPSTSKKLKRRYYEEALNNRYQFPKCDKEFYTYYRSGYSHNDHKYFVRNSHKPIFKQDISLMNSDKRLSTSHDLKVARIIANDMLGIYLEEKINEINNSSNSKQVSIQTNLFWTGKKIDLVEIVYALDHQKVINGGNVHIKEIAIGIGKIFNIDIVDDVYRGKQTLKDRDPVKTKFLSSMTDNLNKKLNEEDSLKIQVK